MMPDRCPECGNTEFYMDFVFGCLIRDGKVFDIEGVDEAKFVRGYCSRCGYFLDEEDMVEKIKD
jgi:predicted nucleic-acid-binding Zn-ribbon protein